MGLWLLVLGGVYLAALIYATIGARRQTRDAKDYLLAGSNIGVIFGSLTVAATLFSTFTLLGMPDFFRQHGVGAWIFLGVSDAVLAFIVLWFGLHLRRAVRTRGFDGMSGLMHSSYGTRWAGVLYLAGVFVFLIPYVAIQIRGVSIFIDATFPGLMPLWAWAAMLVAIMLTYSELGGLKAIIFADAIQGLILLLVTLIIAYGCIAHFDGLAGMFQAVADENSALLSTPGPDDLFSTQFLLASFLVLILIPVTQPQVSMRLVIMRDANAMKRMSVLLGVFAILVIASTIPIGMYGAVYYPELATSEFLSRTLITDQIPIIGAAVLVGLVAAAISTADSQLFALGLELQSMLPGNAERNLPRTRVAILCFALSAFVVAINSTDQLVLLARISFAGTALLAPMIIAAIFAPRRPGRTVIAATAAALIVFLSAAMGVLPNSIGEYRLDLVLLLSLATFTLLDSVIRNHLAITSQR